MPTPAKNVLVLYSFSDRALFDSLDSLKSALRAQVPPPVNFYVEFMETQRLEDLGYETSLSQALGDMYGKVKLDLLIVAAYPALRFALTHRDVIFPGVSIVFCYVHEGRVNHQKLPPGVTGVLATVDVHGSLDLAFRLSPDTKNVVLITGTSEFERYWLGIFHNEFRPYQNKVNLIEMIGLPTDRLMQQVSTRPPHTAVFFQVSPKFSTQPAVGTYELLATMGQHFPTYCIFAMLCLDHGGIGGSYSYDNVQVEKTAEAAGRILAGEKAENIPVAHDSGARVEVDWRQLRRWNIPESILPRGSIVLYRGPTVWRRYAYFILGAVAVILLQTMLIAGLMWERTKKRKSEMNLREGEERFRIMADTTPALIWMSDREGRIIYLNKKILEFTGADLEAIRSGAWVNHVHPDDLAEVLAANARAQDRRTSFSKEYRLRRRDGVYRWMLDVGAPRFNTNGSFAGFIGSATDISDQKAAQEGLEKLGGRLIEAQEKERRFIARELHDDICQRLAVLSLEIEQATQNTDRERMQEIWQHCSDITGDVQALSHELHSSMLDFLGLVAAVQSFCREFSLRQDVSVAFTQENVPPFLSREVSLCLFRVVQEALHNAVKYSGVNHFEVHLRGSQNRVEVEIRDDGVGFDVEHAKTNGGLGLISMLERVHLVNGAITFESKPNRGTNVRANVPLVTARQTRAADAAIA